MTCGLMRWAVSWGYPISLTDSGSLVATVNWRIESNFNNCYNLTRSQGAAHQHCKFYSRTKPRLFVNDDSFSLIPLLDAFTVVVPPTRRFFTRCSIQ